MSASLLRRTAAESPFPGRTRLSAGPLSMVFEEGDLRAIGFGEREVIRRIYGAVRDRNWGTVPTVISGLQMQTEGDRFAIRYAATHRRDEIHFVWQAEIVGQTDGSIRFVFDGEARTSFLRNRIGLCVLHPAACAGMSCAVERRDGTRVKLAFPGLVEAAQPVAGFSNLATISHEAGPGVRVELAFAGEAFEMEDQRNWIDASFKIYGTPLSTPFPVEVPAGTRVRQEVLLRLLEEKSTTRAKPNGVDVSARSGDTSSAPVVIRLVDEITKLPEVGLGMASHGQLLSPREIERLRSLRPGHVRVDLEFDKKSWEERLSVVLRNAESLDCPLELALHLTDEPKRDLADLAEALTRSRLPSFEFLVRARAFRRIIVLSAGRKTTTEASLSAARTFLRGMDLPLHGLLVGGGTAADFCQLNQFRPEADGMDFVCWSMNPQVHAADSTSIAETPEAVPAQIASAKAFFRGAPLVVSPITLKPRFNPVATGPAADPTGRALPPEVDPRQLSQFAASWTLAMLKALAESGAHGVTFFETTGWRGVMETDTGSPLPERFPSTPGMVFPLYHVLADVGEFCGGEIVTTESDNPSGLVSLYLAHGPRRRLLLANLGAIPLRVATGEFSGFNLIRHLNATSQFTAMNSPETFRSGAGAGPVEELILAPCDYATLDSPEP